MDNFCPKGMTLRNDMKVKKHYEQDHVILYVTEGDLQTTITLESDRQMKRLADCLTDLYRTDGREVSIGEDIEHFCVALAASDQRHKH